MAKRPLGLSKASGKKKLKSAVLPEESSRKSSEDTTDNAADAQLAVELDEEADANDELSQLKALWKTFINSERNNELVLNGVIHECDRLLRAAGEKPALDAVFHAVYAMALAEMAYFKLSDSNEAGSASEDTPESFIAAAVDRIEAGFAASSSTGVSSLTELKLAKLKTLLIDIFTIEIPKLREPGDKAGKENSLHTKINEAKELYDEIEESALASNLIDSYHLQSLTSLFDLFDVVPEMLRAEQDSAEEEEDENDEIDIPETHPYYIVREEEEDTRDWLMAKLQKLLSSLTGGEEAGKSADSRREKLLKSVHKYMATEYLRQAAPLAAMFLDEMYGDGDNSDEETEDAQETEDDDGEAKLSEEGKQVREKAQELYKLAIEHLIAAEDDEVPQSWADVAEAQVSLSNLYPVKSAKQEELYALALERLEKANDATKGQFEEVIESLREE